MGVSYVPSMRSQSARMAAEGRTADQDLVERGACLAYLLWMLLVEHEPAADAHFLTT